MTILHNIKHWLKKKIYHAWLHIDEERTNQEKENLCSSFKSIGLNFQIGKDYSICGAENISIGNNFRALSHFRMQAISCHASIKYKPNLVIGNNVSFEDYCHIGCIESVKIGNGTLIASKVFITDHFHGDAVNLNIEKPFDRKLISKPVSIGNNCWIGDSVSILPGVTLGDNVIVGANSVVTHNFPTNSVIAGCPAKMIRKLC